MFDRLFPRHQTRERHMTSPLFQERLDYLQHCAAEGYASTTLRPLATDLVLPSVPTWMRQVTWS